MNVSQSGATLPAGTQAQAQNFETLFLLDAELMAYGAATGTAGKTYALTYLSAQPTARQPRIIHPARRLSLEGPTAAAVLPRSAKGTTVFFKFQAVNIFGKGAQDLSTCATSSLMVTGRGLSS